MEVLGGHSTTRMLLAQHHLMMTEGCQMPGRGHLKIWGDLLRTGCFILLVQKYYYVKFVIQLA